MPIQYKEPLELLEGYSVAKNDNGFIVYRNGEFCAHIKMITSLSGWTMPAFTWHDRHMWNYRASDFVRNVP